MAELANELKKLGFESWDSDMHVLKAVTWVRIRMETPETQEQRLDRDGRANLLPNKNLIAY